MSFKIGEDEKPNEQNEETPKIIPAGWELFSSILTELEKELSVKTKILSFQIEVDSSASVNQPQGVYYPCYLKGRKIAWSFLNKAQTRRRQAMLAEIENNNKIYYLLDTEINSDDKNDRYSMLLINNNDHKILNEEFWKTLFIECVRNRGGQRDSWSWEKAQRRNIRHDWRETTKYTAIIKEYLTSFAQ